MASAPNLRDLPSVDEVVSALEHLDFPRQLIVAETRLVLDEMRAEIRAGQSPQSPVELVKNRLLALALPSLQRVINATGVVLHTNLGRAPLPQFEPHFGCTNLEYDLARGRRGKRGFTLNRFSSAWPVRPALLSTTMQAAVYLALNTLAASYEVIVSRGELIEIGDGFRIPDIMASSGAILKEVGTTNRTHIDDYRAAITGRTRLLLRVHPSNFRIQGFTARPELRELAALGKEHDVLPYSPPKHGRWYEATLVRSA